MSARATPPFRADQVGSLIRPQALIDAREAAKSGAMSPAQLLDIQHAAIREVVRMQEEVGLKVVTDGEFNRFSWQRDFLLKIANVAPAEAKVTMPSPTILHFRGGRSSVDEVAYPDMADFFSDLAKVYREELADLYAKGCRYAQIDEVNLAYLCDPVLREQAAGFGEDPNQLPKTYAKLINDSIAGQPADMAICMHLCRGNFAGAWIAEGGYEPVADLLFNEVNVTGYFLEFDSERAGGFEPLRFLPKGKVAVLGLVTTKNSAMETKDDLKRRIEEAAKYAPLDQLALSAQCGFSSGIGGETMTVEREFEKLQLIVETAREVWGSA